MSAEGLNHVSHAMSIATMPWPTPCSQTSAAPGAWPTSKNLPPSGSQMWPCSHRRNFSTMKCFKWRWRFTSNHSDMSRLPRSYIPTRPPCKPVNSRVGWNVWVFVLLDPTSAPHGGRRPRGGCPRMGLRGVGMGTLAGVGSFLPHCAFQSVKDLCPQYLANALSVDWLNPPCRCTRPKNRFNVDTPKARVKRQFPLEHLAVAARRHVKTRRFTDRSCEPTDVRIVGVDLFGHVAV